MLTFSDITITGPGIFTAENDISDLLIKRPIITTLYTANATFVVPDLCESISVAVVGGGGGGAVGSSGTSYGGGGGGGGGVAYRNDIKVIPGETLTIVVGEGGLGGLGGVTGSIPTATNNGSSGGATYIERSTGERFVIAGGGGGGTAKAINGQGGGLPGLGGTTLGTGAIGSYGGFGGGAAVQSATLAFPGGGGGAGGFPDSAFGGGVSGGYLGYYGGGNGSPGISVTGATAGIKGGGGGGGYGYATIGTFAGNGGGTDLAANINTASLTNGSPGTQGVGGTQGSDSTGSPDLTTTFGGGGAGAMGGTGFAGRARSGGQGGLLLLSPGDYRKFPKPTASQIPNYDIINASITNVNYSADFRPMNWSTYIPTSEVTNTTNTCTIEFWLYLAGARPNVNVAILSPGSIGCDGLYISIGGALGTQMRIGANYQTGITSLRAVYLNSTVSTGVWQHYVFQYNAGDLLVYKNGYLVGQTLFNGVNTSGQWLKTPVPSSLTIGNYAGGGNFYLNGLISNLRIVKGKALYPISPPQGVQIFVPPTVPYDLTTNGSTPNGYGALTNPLSSDVRLLAFQSSSLTRDYSQYGDIGTLVAEGTPVTATLSPF